MMSTLCLFLAAGLVQAERLHQLGEVQSKDCAVQGLAGQLASGTGAGLPGCGALGTSAAGVPGAAAAAAAGCPCGEAGHQRLPVHGCSASASDTALMMRESQAQPLCMLAACMGWPSGEAAACTPVRAWWPLLPAPALVWPRAQQSHGLRMRQPGPGPASPLLTCSASDGREHPRGCGQGRPPCTAHVSSMQLPCACRHRMTGPTELLRAGRAAVAETSVCEKLPGGCRACLPRPPPPSGFRQPLVSRHGRQVRAELTPPWRCWETVMTDMKVHCS